MKHAPILALLTLVSQALGDCSCGYSVNGIDTDKFGLFTHIMETDFLHAKKIDLAIHSNFDKDWITEEHNKTAKELGTKFGTSMQTGNVLVNPLPDGQWGGQAATAADPGLQLWVRHAVDKERIPIAAVNVNQFIRGKNRGMHYGSFGAAIKFSGMNGTRGAFIWKSKDKSSGQNILMEFSANQSRILAVTANTENAASTWNWTAAVECPQEFHEYRFDLLPGRIDFFFDSIPAGTTCESIPDSAGTLELVHRVDNGFANPPAQDAIMTIGYVKAYYNTTSRDQPPPGCRDLHENVCPIHDQKKAPNPDGKMTEFFTLPSDGSAVEKDEEVATPGIGRDYPGSAPGLNVGLIFVNLTFWTAFILLWV
jgi:hypothetical protein